jgi:hypothetical protein
MIAFDEARFILQAAAAQPSLLSLRWFGTDAVAFSPLIVNDPVALQVAQQVQLSATIFTGALLDHTCTTTTSAKSDLMPNVRAR